MPNDCFWSNYIPKISARCLYNACQNEIRRNYLQILKYPLSNPFLLQYYCSVKYRKIKMKVKKEKSFSLLYIKKQPSRGVLRKRCSENMQQIYRRTPFRSAISIKLLYNFIEIGLQHGCSPVNLLHIFRTSFPSNTLGRLLLTLETAYNFFVSWRNFHW